MSEPAKEQIREFWEWCGFDYVYHGWRHSSGDENLYLLSAPPPIDLNNLFKWAKDAVIKKYGKKEWHRILHEWIDSFAGSLAEDEDPALALFWALDKVRDETNSS